MHHADLQRLLGAEQLALQDVGLRRHQAQHPRHLGDAAATGDQPQRDFGQTELHLGVVDGDAVVADECHLPATAQRRAVQTRHHRHTLGLDGAEVALDAFDLGEHARAVGLGRAHHTLEVGTGEESAFGRSEHDALELRAVVHHLRRNGVQVVLPLQAHGVDRRALLVERDGGNAVGQVVADGFRDHYVLHVFGSRNTAEPALPGRWCCPLVGGDARSAARGWVVRPFR